MSDIPGSLVEITAHARLVPPALEARVLALFEELGMELQLADDALLLGWAEDGALTIEVSHHPLEAGWSQVRWVLRCSSAALPRRSRDLAEALLAQLAADGGWRVDGLNGLPPRFPGGAGDEA